MLLAIRWILPAVVVFAGILVMALGNTDGSLEGGAGIIGAGLAIWLLNWLYRMGVTGDSARDEEDDARAYFDRHGRWPDDPS
jgi:hypothetical protein